MEDWFIDLIKNFEGFRPKAYWDVDHYSIGYGTDTMPNGQPVKEGDTITEPEAVKLIPKYTEKRIPALKKIFPNWDKMTPQMQYALISHSYRGGLGNFAKSSPKFTKAVNDAIEDDIVNNTELQNIVKEMEIGAKTGGIKNRTNIHAALLANVYNPKYNKQVYDKNPYSNFYKEAFDPNTFMGQIVAQRNKSQDFVQRMQDPNREVLDLGNGQVGTHKLSYRTGDDGEAIVYPEIINTPKYPIWDLLHLTAPKKKLIDYSSDRDKAFKVAVSLGDTIHMPASVAEEFTTRYKDIYPNFKQGGTMNYLDYFKNGGIHIKKKNKGKFTDYCGGTVTEECIQRGKHSSNPTTRKRATFAANARKWKHKDGGELNYLNLFD